jgi:hypothetical protein
MLKLEETKSERMRTVSPHRPRIKPTRYSRAFIPFKCGCHRDVLYSFAATLSSIVDYSYIYFSFPKTWYHLDWLLRGAILGPS